MFNIILDTIINFYHCRALENASVLKVFMECCKRCVPSNVRVNEVVKRCSSLFIGDRDLINTAVHSQTEVTAYLQSQPLLLFDFARNNGCPLYKHSQ